jgi:hypothetical protein
MGRFQVLQFSLANAALAWLAFSYYGDIGIYLWLLVSIANAVIIVSLVGGPGSMKEVLSVLWLPDLPVDTEARSEQYTHQTVLITGANRGLGRGVARHFLKNGAATVILAIRSGIPQGERSSASMDSHRD